MYKAGGERAAVRVDKHVGLLAVIPGKFFVNGRTVEVVAPDVAFERDVICGFRHGKTIFDSALMPRRAKGCHEVAAIIIWRKRQNLLVV